MKRVRGNKVSFDHIRFLGSGGNEGGGRENEEIQVPRVYGVMIEGCGFGRGFKKINRLKRLKEKLKKLKKKR